MQNGQGTVPYTNVPVGSGGNANYPAKQKVSGTSTYPTSEKRHGTSFPTGQSEYVTPKSGYGYDGTGYDGTKAGSGYDGSKPGYGQQEYSGINNNNNQKYAGGYVQPTPVAYTPDGRPIVKKNHRLRNAIVGALAVCCCCVVI